MSEVRLGIDVGGTFTDLAAYDQKTGALVTEKVLTTHGDPAEGALEGVRRMRAAGLAMDRISTVVHGTTLVSNALIERRGARTVLLTTRGFGDVLDFGRELRYDVYDGKIAFPAPLVARSLRVEVDERIGGTGAPIIELTDEAARAAVAAALELEPASLAVVLLHSYINPSHERRLEQLIHQQAPNLPVSMSHEVLPQMREYERASATVINAYVQPLFRSYLKRLRIGLAQERCHAEVFMMSSSGGTISVDTAERFPLQLVESGPAAGTLIAQLVGAQVGDHSVLSFDMGGTTAKASAIKDGRPVITTSHEMARVARAKKGSGLPVGVPVIDLIEIGGGGGSIAEVDAMGLLSVGPRSAGSEPGPACYGRGGKDATVTDANVVLGLIDPEAFLGGDMLLDADAAEAALRRGVGEPLGMAATDAAAAIHRVVTESMTEAARVHAVEMNVDIRRFTMVCFGGAGPLHAYAIARRLGIHKVVSPAAAGVLSAVGLLTAPLAFEYSRSLPADLEALDLDQANSLLAELEESAEALLAAVGVKAATLERSVDMCYVGQGFEVRTALASDRLDESNRDRLKADFDDAYERTYGRRLAQLPARCVTWRVLARGPEPAFDISAPASSSRDDGARQRDVFIPDFGQMECRVYHRHGLQQGQRLLGPALVQERTSVLVVPPDAEGTIDHHGNVVMTIG